jgi:thioredoxin reductase
MYDVLVVGGGPAGLAAALWAARYRRSVLLVDSGDYRNKSVVKMHGYLGLDDADPAELRAHALTDLARYAETTVVQGTVRALRQDAACFIATVDGLGEVVALRVVLATGVVDEFPEIDGFDEHYGASVFHCPTCDGYESQDQHVVAIGWSEQMAGFALTLLDWASSVTLVTDGRELDIDSTCHDALQRHGVQVVTSEARRFVGTRGDLQGVELADGRCVPCERAFFSVAHRPRSPLAELLGAKRTDEDCIHVDEHGETSVPGLYAAGDMTPGIQLVQVAAAKGAVAGIGAATSLRGEPGVPDTPRPGPDVDAELETG